MILVIVAFSIIILLLLMLTKSDLVRTYSFASIRNEDEGCFGSDTWLMHSLIHLVHSLICSLELLLKLAFQFIASKLIAIAMAMACFTLNFSLSFLSLF